MMTTDEISRFFSEEGVKRAFQFPDWPVGTEIVCYCRSTDSRDAIEQIAQRGGWKIVKQVKSFEDIKGDLAWKIDQVLDSEDEACELFPKQMKYIARRLTNLYKKQDHTVSVPL